MKDETSGSRLVRGSELESPPDSMDEVLKGTVDRQAEMNRSTPIDVEGGFEGNVTGCLSQPVSLGRKR